MTNKSDVDHEALTEDQRRKCRGTFTVRIPLVYRAWLSSTFPSLPRYTSHSLWSFHADERLKASFKVTLTILPMIIAICGNQKAMILLGDYGYQMGTKSLTQSCRKYILHGSDLDLQWQVRLLTHDFRAIGRSVRQNFLAAAIAHLVWLCTCKEDEIN